MDTEHHTFTRLAVPSHARSNHATVLPAQRAVIHQPCDLPTAYITSRESDGECASPHAASQEPNSNPPACQASYRLYAPRH
jgi:hypothetical protein